MSELKVDKVSPRTGTYVSLNTVGMKNIIINGDMSLAQRSTSVASITGSGYNTVDRFRTNMGTAGTWTQSQSTDVPTGQGFATSFKMDCTTANGSLSAGSFLIIDQRVEGQNLQYLKKGTANALSTTLSFWVKSAKTGTYIVALEDTDNTRYIANSYTISLADTWEKKTITYAGDTTGAFGNDNGGSLKVQFWLVAGSTYTSGTLATSWETTTNANLAVGQVNLADDTANDWYITGVQLEAGTTASDFEFLPVDVNLGRCQRYYYKIQPTTNRAFGMGLCYTTNILSMPIDFPTTMRTAPSALEQNGTAGDYQVLKASSFAVCTSVPTHQGGTTWGSLLDFNVTGTITAGQAGQGWSVNGDAYLAWSAEL
jgi:hypothetical protein